MEQRGLDFDPGSQRTSEIGREDAEAATNSAQGSGLEDGSSDYDIVLDASITVNSMNQSNRPSQFIVDIAAISGVEQRVNATFVCKRIIQPCEAELL